MADKAFEKELKELRKLAGVGDYKLTPYVPENFGAIASKLSKIQKQRKIKPGDKDWFRLWFARPHLTGEKPYD